MVENDDGRAPLERKRRGRSGKSRIKEIVNQAETNRTMPTKESPVFGVLNWSRLNWIAVTRQKYQMDR